MNSDPHVRLCLAARLFYPLYGGGALRFARYLPGLAERGVETTVFTATASAARTEMSGLSAGTGVSAGQRLSVEVVNGAPVHRVQLPNNRGDVLRAASFGSALVRFCRESARLPDVVQLVSSLAPITPALLRLRRLGVPIVSSVTVAPHMSSGLKGRVAAHAYALPTRLIDALIVSSEALRDRLRLMNVAAPMVVIPNGVDTERFRPSRPDDSARLSVRSRLGIAPDHPVLLTVGAVCPRKNPELLLEAWAILASRRPDLHLIVAGPRKDTADPDLNAFRRRLDTLLASSGAADRVHFIGLVDDIEACYRAADVFVFTSRREGMPNAVLEAMASGLPVVTTPFVGLAPEIGAPESEFVLSSFSPAAFAASVQRLLDSPDLRAGFGAAGRRWVVRRMALDQALDRYAELYRALAGRRAGARYFTGAELSLARASAGDA